MSWLDDYRQASFRGVEFYIAGHEGRGGRRQQNTEFPGRETPYVEDLGRKSFSGMLEAYVIGDDYNIQRNKLIIALDKKGPGLLVHPYHGNMQVAITEYTWRDTVRDGGMAHFSINIIEVGELKFPSITVDTVAKVAIAKQSSLDALIERFVALWDLTKYPRSIVDSAFNTIDQGLSGMEQAKNTVSSVSAFRRDLENLQGRLSVVMFDAQELMENVTDLMRFGTDPDNDDFDVTEEKAAEAFEDTGLLTTLEPTDIISGDPDEPALMFATDFKISAIIIQISLLSLINFESVEQAEELRNQTYTILDQIMESISDDDLYNALYDLRTSASEHIDSVARKLPRRVEYIPIVSLPAMVISHEVYGVISREQEIIDRNRIGHPGFVTGGESIEILIDV